MSENKAPIGKVILRKAIVDELLYLYTGDDDGDIMVHTPVDKNQAAEIANEIITESEVLTHSAKNDRISQTLEGCEWVIDRHRWRVDCLKAADSIDVDLILMHKYKFCPFCGKEIKYNYVTDRLEEKRNMLSKEDANRFYKLDFHFIKEITGGVYKKVYAKDVAENSEVKATEVYDDRVTFRDNSGSVHLCVVLMSDILRK